MKTINVRASNNIWSELGNTTYELDELFAEFIDNSIAARNNELNVTIRFDLVNDSPKAICIYDNAKGIAFEDLALALSPAALQSSNSLNEHGLGLKQAVASLGNLSRLATKTKNDEKAHQINKLAFGELDVDVVDDALIVECGTLIEVHDIKQIGHIKTTALKTSFASRLGARYRRFLKNKDKPFTITIITTQNGSQTQHFDIKPYEPIYFNRSSRTNAPEFEKVDLIGGDWSAELTFGYAPEGEQYEDLGMGKVKQWEPYAVSRAKQGLDVIMHDRVILFAQLLELGVVSGEHSDYNLVRGELVLKTGFKTANTKNAVMKTENYKEVCEAVKDILTGVKAPKKGLRPRNYLGDRVNYSKLPEKLLRDRLADFLSKDPRSEYESITKEHPIGDLGVSADIKADNEIWELKKGQADPNAVFQLFMYLDVTGLTTGFLVADNFSTGASEAIKFINQKHDVDIKEYPLEHLPIRGEVTKDEVEKYFN